MTLIDDSHSGALTTQQYGGQNSIDGVELFDLKLHSDDGGNFVEVLRLSKGKVDIAGGFTVAQLSMSIMVPDTIKAYHVHKKQADLWFVPPNNRLLVNLHDLRKDSKTNDQHQRLVLGGMKTQLLYIPAGVAHGAKNCYSQDAIMFYATNQQFDAKNPDEHRLPWDRFGAEKWEIAKG